MKTNTIRKIVATVIAYVAAIVATAGWIYACNQISSETSLLGWISYMPGFAADIAVVAIISIAPIVVYKVTYWLGMHVTLINDREDIIAIEDEA